MNPLAAPAKDGAPVQSKRQKEIEATRKLLAESSRLLKEVDESEILTSGRKRLYPTFERSELKFGPLLGVGGFGIVFEVKDFNLKIPTVVEVTETKSNQTTAEATEAAATDAPSGATATDAATPSESNENGGDAATDAHGGSDDLTERSHTGDDSQSPIIHTTIAFNKNDNDFGEYADIEELPNSTAATHDDEHYDVYTARKLMARMARRNGDARYAVKRLHRDLTDLERARGMIDLAIEAKYLSVVWHPNIVKMRGMSTGDLLSPNFFIIMDRLYETLVEKVLFWSSEKASCKGGLFGIGAKSLELDQLMVERLIVAYDLAAAFAYMHDHKLIYRDIKQENIAFDCRGDVKVFDMGLCRSLNPALRSKDRDGRVAYGYLLTPRTGSVPYMAPEVVECKPYDDKCDVFSFSILLWEIMSLKPAFKGYSRREFLERVVRGGERHTINRRWPPLTRTMIKEAWDHDPEKRPDMKRLAVMIRGDLNAKTSDPAVQQRSIHMRERSEASFRLSREQSDDSFRLSRTAALSLSTSSRNVPVSFHARNSAASIAASSVSSSGLQ